MRRACIDIGSNTTRLLVADDAPAGLAVVCEQRAFTRIGATLAGGDTIPEAKCAEVQEVVAGQLARARSLGAREIHAVATAAVRRAANAEALLSCLRDGPGLEVAVLSARDEARLAFRGATGMLDVHPDGPLGVLDVGGGSTEAVVGSAGGAVQWWASLPLGSGRLAADHLRHDPPSADELAAVRRTVVAAVARVAFDGPTPARTLAVGGSATSLCRLAGQTLDRGALQRACELLCASPAAEVSARHGIAPERVRLLPAGLIVLQELGSRVGGRLEVGRGGVREGVLLEALAR